MRGGWAQSSEISASPYSYEGVRWQRYGREPPLISRNAGVVLLAALLLTGFVVTDVGLASSLPAKVTVTQVNWFVGNLSAGNSSGFSVAAGHSFVVSLVCTIFCVQFVGVSVASPFSLVNDTITVAWFEYVNVTVRAPGSSFDGPLAVTLTSAL